MPKRDPHQLMLHPPVLAALHHMDRARGQRQECMAREAGYDPNFPAVAMAAASLEVEVQHQTWQGQCTGKVHDQAGEVRGWEWVVAGWDMGQIRGQHLKVRSTSAEV